MFAPGYFPKSYFAGTYYPPNSDGDIVDAPGFSYWVPLFRPRRR
jgi:hypothetical protein